MSDTIPPRNEGAAHAGTRSPRPPGSGPLDGIRVIDLTSVIMGPYAGQILGDLGAEVIKVESPEGDVMRAAGPNRSAGMGHVYLNVNRNKRSVVLDLKDSDGRDALLRLVETADVLIYNVRPQAMKRLRLAYEDVRAVNPRIIYAGGFGFGQDGPYAQRAAFDDLMQAMSGTAALQSISQGTVDGEAAPPRYVPINFCDRVSGLHMLYAVLAALYARERSGEGQAIEVPMFETMAAFVLGEHLGGYTFEPRQGPMGYARIVTPYRRPYRSADGYISVMPYNDKQWRAFFDAIGSPGTMQDPRFATQEGRAANIEAVYAYMEQEIAKRPNREWVELLTRADIAHSPVKSLEDLHEDPHLQAVGFFEPFEHPSEGELRRTKIPTKFSGTPATVRRHAPLLGEHTEEVLREIGLPEDMVTRLATRVR
ncbi:MAG: CoA transferase [Burkholderiaceae bacterium]